MLEFGIAEVDRRGDGAGSLREHLEALTVERRREWQPVLDVGDDNLAHVYRLLAVVSRAQGAKLFEPCRLDRDGQDCAVGGERGWTCGAEPSEKFGARGGGGAVMKSKR